MPAINDENPICRVNTSSHLLLGARRLALAAAVSIFAITTFSVSDADASYAEWMCKRESQCRLDATNDNSTASGLYQMTQGALESAGLIEITGDIDTKHYGKGSWDNVTWKENQWGINSREDFLNSREAQDWAFEQYSKNNWNAIKSQGLDQYIGASFNGQRITEAGLLGAAHLLGPKGLADYLETGHINQDVLANHPNIEQMLEERFREFSEFDVAHITGETAEGAYAGQDVGRGPIMAEGAACDPQVAELLAQASTANIDAATTLASHEGVGFSQMDESFAFFSCLEDLLSGGVDFTFRPPSLSDILGMLEDYMCQAAEELYAKATAPINDALGQVSGGINEAMGGFSAIPIVGDHINLPQVDVKFNKNAQGSISDRFNYGEIIRNPNDPWGYEQNMESVDNIKAALLGINKEEYRMYYEERKRMKAAGEWNVD